MDAARQRLRVLTLGTTDVDFLRQPWERVANSDGPLAIRGVTIRRQLTGSGKILEHRLNLPLRVLLVVSRPTDLGFIDSRNITAPILEALKHLPQGDVEVEFCDPPTLPQLERIASPKQGSPDPITSCTLTATAHMIAKLAWVHWPYRMTTPRRIWLPAPCWEIYYHDRKYLW